MNQKQIINTYDQLRANGGGVAIVVSYGGIRDRHVNGWKIFRLNHEGKQVTTDKNAHWSDNNMKWFSTFNHMGTFHNKRKAALLEAQKWVQQQGWYDGPWERNGQGDFVPEAVQKQFRLRRNK